MSKLEGGGSIDEEVGRGDGLDEVSTTGASLHGELVMGASLDVSDLSDGCATTGIYTLRD